MSGVKKMIIIGLVFGLSLSFIGQTVVALKADSISAKNEMFRLSVKAPSRVMGDNNFVIVVTDQKGDPVEGAYSEFSLPNGWGICFMPTDSEGKTTGWAPPVPTRMIGKLTIWKPGYTSAKAEILIMSPFSLLKAAIKL